MGSQFDYRTFADMDREKLAQAFKDWQEDTRHDSGHGGYTGTIAEARGLTFEASTTYKGEAAASKYVQDRAQKWGSAIAVPYVVIAAFHESPTYKDIEARINAIAARLNEFDAKIIAQWQAGKSKTKGCRYCGSSISIAHLKAKNPQLRFFSHHVDSDPEAKTVDRWNDSTKLRSLVSPAEWFVLEQGSVNIRCPVCNEHFEVGSGFASRKRDLAEQYARLMIEAYKAKLAYLAGTAGGEKRWFVGAWCSS